MFEILTWIGISLPVLYYLLIIVLKKISPNPLPPSKESLVYRSGLRPDRRGSTLRNINDPINRSLRPEVELSVIIPAYNEEDRLKSGLSDALKFLEDRRKQLSSNSNRTTTTTTSSSSSSSSSSLEKKTNKKEKEKDENFKDSFEVGSYEVLIVDDGSKDKTTEVALQLSIDHSKIVDRPDQAEIRLISLGKNRGKGGAVKHGILHSRGNRVLFADADGASNFSDLTNLMKKLDEISISIPTQKNNLPNNDDDDDEDVKGSKDEDEEEKEFFGITIGSRAHLVSSESVVSRSRFRNFLMKSFHLYLYVLGLRDIRDTQCGFKLMTRPTAREVVSNIHVEGWIFDVELLLIGKLMEPRIPIEEVFIGWNEVEGSKLSIVRDSISMAIELLMIRLNYFLGIWKVPKRKS